MKPCPFCGKKVEARFPFISEIKADGTWNFNHHCNFGGELTVTIDCWGRSKEECIQRWNNRGKVETNESP